MIRRTFPKLYRWNRAASGSIAPLIALDELGDLLREPRVQRLELRLSFVLVLPDLVVGECSTAAPRRSCHCAHPYRSAVGAAGRTLVLVRGRYGMTL